MKKAYIISTNILDYETQKIRIGGVQTYVWNLASLLKENNYIPIIIQISKEKFIKKINDVEVLGIESKSKKIRIEKKMIKKYLKKKVKEEDVVVFSTDTLNFQNTFKKSVSIQHGIYWDMNKKPFLGSNLLENVMNTARSMYIRKRIEQVKLTVTVDYNFINWFRTQEAKNKNLFRPIPNFSYVNESLIKKDDNEILNIIFARRFEIYRGTRIFTVAIEKILEKYKNIKVIFAGDGSDSNYLKNKFKNTENVEFFKYKYEDSLKIHEKIDIAVIPTTGSEGTSLSALEAMASKCAIVSTNVGGLSNMIIDNYNGLLINPCENELFDALEKLIQNADLRKKLSLNSFNTVDQAFNKKTWDKKWLEVIKEIEIL